jgi:hypothetical protein
MSDDLLKKRPQDASRISLSEDWEVRYWCKEFGCTETELRNAVKKVGSSSKEVRKHFGK